MTRVRYEEPNEWRRCRERQEGVSSLLPTSLQNRKTPTLEKYAVGSQLTNMKDPDGLQIDISDSCSAEEDLNIYELSVLWCKRGMNDVDYCKARIKSLREPRDLIAFQEIPAVIERSDLEEWVDSVLYAKNGREECIQSHISYLFSDNLRQDDQTPWFLGNFKGRKWFEPLKLIERVR